MKKKNPSIELVRIVAILLVIMAHSQLGVSFGETLVKGRLAISTMIADDVPLFLLVTGFFFFGRVKQDSDIATTFKYKLKSFAKTIYIPTILFILISIIYRYFAQSVPSLADADWDYLGRFVFRLSPGDHLWYICTYMSFVFFFPMLAFICQDSPEKNKLRRLLLAVAVGGAVIADVQYFFRMSMLDIEKYLWGYCTIFLILGYELSLWVKKFDLQQMPQRLKLAAVGAGLYLAGFMVKFGAQIYMFEQYNYGNNRFRWLQCTPCFVTAVGMFLLVYAIGSLVKKEGKLALVINFFGSCTFAIYLFHQLVINETGAWRNSLVQTFSGSETFLTAAGYYGGYALAVFFTTFVVALVFKLAVDNSVGRIFKIK